MATKRIQLRGISRTPSDRMTNDGGCAESLNMFLHEGESAPVLIPNDITSDLGLPAALQAERIFIHKTANYENYVAISQDRIVAITPNVSGSAPTTILELQNGDTVNDITSIGNTLIIATNNSLYYVLYNNREYSFLGSSIPFPQIEFQRTSISAFENIMAQVGSSNGFGDEWFRGVIPTEENWNAQSEEGNEHTGDIKRCLTALWEEVTSLLTEARKSGYLTSPVFLTYAVELYDGEEAYRSMPILIPSTVNENLRGYVWSSREEGERSTGTDEEGNDVTEMYSKTTDYVKLVSEVQKYKIYAKLEEENFLKWKDIMSKIKIYMSPQIEWGIQKYSTQLSNRQSKTEHYPTNRLHYYAESSGDITFNVRPEYKEDILFNSSQTFLIKEVEIFNEAKTALSEDLRNLISGQTLDIQKFIDSTHKDHVLLEEQERTKASADMKHYLQAAYKLNTYNNSLILTQPSNIIAYDYNRLNAYDAKTNEDSSQHYDIWRKYDITYLLKGVKNDKVVKAGPFLYEERVEGGIKETIYQFQIFPDSRAYKMQVKVELYQDSLDDLIAVKYAELDMLPHPYLDCAYFYGALGETLHALCTLDDVNSYNINAIDDIENKLLISEINNPFSFPVEHRYTFQSAVLGVAIANTALSQGQFGQFPLYIFTEDGIWAMETGADGSFVTKKPLSREVCINPDSITAIDNAVVFVTAQGVMLIQGSQVVNISPYMNGRHYDIENAAKSIIEGQSSFAPLLSALTDNTHFMAYVKEASIAYDYAGQRLIFIKKGEDYQYIYKLDTKTWHKSAYGVNLVAPINSYPECLVMGKGEGVEKKYLKITSFAESQLNEYQLSEDFMLYFGDSYGLTEEQLIEVFTGLEMLNITEWSDDHLAQMKGYLETERVYYEIVPKSYIATKVLDLSTILDAAESKTPTKGVIATRPFDLDEPDVFKTITDVRIRGQFRKGAVKFILLGSNDGVTFSAISTLRGKAWKLFRIIILADLQPTERISWIDVQYETRFTNRLR